MAIAAVATNKINSSLTHRTCGVLFFFSWLSSIGRAADL
jgi:hypothetical protein